jgi:alpha-glucoside transport system substrate-binding protein
VLQQFTDETGIHVRYTGSSSFISAIRERSEEGNPPDVAVFPQPGLMQGLADSGYVLPLRTDVGSVVNTNILPGLVAAGTTDRGLDGVPVRVSVKSLVWYSPEIFEASSYEVPTTWSQLVTLSAEIDQSGITPWCMGISAGDATGWPATDWVEDIVLRQDGTDVYDAWVKGEIPFTDARIGSAIQQFGFLALTGGDAAESRRQIINTTPAEAQNPMFRSPPQCVMYKQGSFQRDNLPSGTTFGPDGDVDIFVLPGLTDDVPPPMLVGGDIAAAMTNRKETWQLLTYLATPEAGRPWADRGNYTSPNKNFDPAWYSDPFDVRMSDLLNSADVVRFDGSDLMYAPVGTDSFLDAMTIYVASSRLELAQETAQAGYSR